MWHAYLTLELLTGKKLKERVGENNVSIPPTLDGWVYIEHIQRPLDGPLYTCA